MERKSVSVLSRPSVAVTEEEGSEFSGVAFTEYKSYSGGLYTYDLITLSEDCTS